MAGLFLSFFGLVISRSSIDKYIYPCLKEKNLTIFSPIKSESENLPGKVILKMGVFPRIPVPEMEGFDLHRHPWEPLCEGTVRYKLVRGGEAIES